MSFLCKANIEFDILNVFLINSLIFLFIFDMIKVTVIYNNKMEVLLMKKRILSLILTLALLVSSLCCLSGIQVSAATLDTIPDNIKPFIFDPFFYAEKHPDLKSAFGYDEGALYQHFKDYGIAEGRVASMYFDVAWYRTQNDQELVEHCNGDNIVAMNHFLLQVNNYYEMDHHPKKLSPILDMGYYSNRYPDLKVIAGFTTEFDYLNHFVNSGVYEGRQASAEFDPVSYAIYNDDLHGVMGTDARRYGEHYMASGREETDNENRQKVNVISDLGDDFYATITDKNSQKNLDVSYGNADSNFPKGNKVVINTPSESDSQIWHFMRQSDGTYKIINKSNGKLLENYDYSRTDAKLGVATDNPLIDKGSESQRWHIYEDNGYCYLRAKCSDHVATVTNGATEDNSEVASACYDNLDNQAFMITVVSEEDTYVEPVEKITATEKLTAFTGNTIWADASADPANSTSLLPLVKMYHQTDTQYYFYLPETADLSALPICFSGYESVKIGQYEIQNGWGYSFSENTSYRLYLNGEYAGGVVFLKSDSPAMYIETKEAFPVTTFATNADGEALNHKDNYSTKGTIATAEEGQDYIETVLKKIKGRGNASWTFSYENFGKYSFNITLESKTKLYSTMGKGKKFCLLAQNGDEAYMRNIYSFLLGDDIGCEFTPRFQYVDLYNNNEYMGSFLLTDKIEVNSQSVDLSCSLDDLNEAANPDVELDACTRMSTTNNLNDKTTIGYKKWVDIAEVTTYEDGTPFDAKNGDGTYLLELELRDRFPNEISGFISNKGQQVVVKTPEFASKDQVDFVSALFNNAEEVIYNPDSTLEEINEVIDVDSFIKIYFIQELSKNIDSCQTSYYIYYDSKIDGRLHAAPLWDFDMSYGQYYEPRIIAPGVYGESATTYDWYSKIKGIHANEGVLNIQAAIVNNPEVWQRARILWNGTAGFYSKADRLLNTTGEGTIPDYVEQLADTAEMNESRWNFIERDLIAAAGLNDTGETFKESTDFFINWTSDRLDWMNNGTSNTTHLLFGDVTQDGQVNIRDATELQKVLARLSSYDADSYVENCDLTLDNKVSVRDVTYIQMLCAGMFY